MPETAERAFSELLRRETEPPEHERDFDDRLSQDLYAIDRELGRERRRPRRWRLIALAAALIGLGTAVPALILSGSSSAPTAVELNEIGGVIQRWQDVDFLPWPADYYSADRLPESVHKEMAARRLAVARAVGTQEFLSSYDVTRDHAGTLEEFHKGGEPIVIRNDELVLKVTYERTELDGDVVVRVTEWHGEVSAYWDEEQHGLTRHHKIDVTPVFEYTVRRSGDAWRLVSKRQVEISEDGSGDLFGPNTPHEQLPIQPD
jgi:hypothetical protein